MREVGRTYCSKVEGYSTVAGSRRRLRSGIYVYLIMSKKKILCRGRCRGTGTDIPDENLQVPTDRDTVSTSVMPVGTDMSKKASTSPQRTLEPPRCRLPRASGLGEFQRGRRRAEPSSSLHLKQKAGPGFCAPLFGQARAAARYSTRTMFYLLPASQHAQGCGTMNGATDVT